MSRRWLEALVATAEHMVEVSAREYRRSPSPLKHRRVSARVRALLETEENLRVELRNSP